jgi:hypothetical protein
MVVVDVVLHRAATRVQKVLPTTVLVMVEAEDVLLMVAPRVLKALQKSAKIMAVVAGVKLMAVLGVL